MPPKKKEKAKKKTELSKTGEPAFRICARFLKAYEQACAQASCILAPAVKMALKQAIEDEKFLTKIVLEPAIVNSADDPRVLLEPMLTAVRKERYNYIKALYIWEVPLTNEEITSLALLLEKSIYDIKTLEMIDNMIEVYGMRRLSQALPASPSILSLALDFNEFGDDGCKYLCDGLYGNKTLLSLSLNYCGLSARSSGCLGRIIAHTAVRDVFLDGNDFGCAGTEKLIIALVDKAETEIREKKILEEQKLAAEEAARLAEEKAKSQRFEMGAATPIPPAEPESKEKKKKKKGKKKGKKAPPEPPEPGAWLRKLHLADNGIDAYEQGFDDLQLASCVKALRRLIASSECLQELDLEDNLIGDMGGAELLEAMTQRKESNGLPNIKLRTTHRMQGDTLKQLIKLGAGAIKKKKKGKGKKKK
ncbi:ribonuclease inhibitor-like [Watersipora subatra]|uniref:ribonuclease inhibitor-like n=1 Tax=Watersipora subatra TaxID=2589382 RepID=UPI00355C2000